MALIPYFEFNGKSTRDFGLTIGRGVEIGYPDKNKKIEPLAWTNVQYDFSNLYGNQQYTNRLLKFPIHIMNKSESSIYFQNTKILNWLMSVGRQPFYYSEIPGYYFMAEVVSDVEYDLRHVHDGVLEIVFECYPFMIDRMPEGHDIWDLFNFDLDVSQPTKFTFKSNWTNFKQLNIGDYATYGAWATVYQTDTGTGTKINPGFHGYTYKIVDKKTVSQSRSQIAYKLDNHNEWLLEQDIVQAQTEYLDVVIVNPGISDVAPIITTNSSVTIVRDDEIYNLQPGVFETEQFVLKSGENHLKMYIPNVTLNIDFNFHKELI
ncbi:hypothetical protein [Aerococcus urinaeequi]|uniref:hypothetical protein n=1 Tax=Aerococcus urinaeequi TaxID=51665 RepID=UPI003D6A6432